MRSRSSIIRRMTENGLSANVPANGRAERLCIAPDPVPGCCSRAAWVDCVPWPACADGRVGACCADAAGVRDCDCDPRADCDCSVLLSAMIGSSASDGRPQDAEPPGTREEVCYRAAQI